MLGLARVRVGLIRLNRAFRGRDRVGYTIAVVRVVLSLYNSDAVQETPLFVYKS